MSEERNAMRPSILLQHSTVCGGASSMKELTGQVEAL